MQLSKKQIRNILTLRYDPEGEPALPPLDISDFTPKYSDPDGKETEERLLKNLEFLSKYDSLSIALSSGVDSPLVLALVRKLYPEKKITAIHYAGTNHNELKRTEELANKFNTSFLVVSIDSVFSNIKEMVKILQAPKWDAYDFIIPETAKYYSDILLTGDGADELFAGYTFRLNRIFKEISEKEGKRQIKHVSERIAFYLGCHRNDFVEDQENLFANNENFNEFSFTFDIDPYFFSYFNNDMELYNQFLLADFNGKLIHNFLVKKNAFSKRYNIEIYSPFLESNIIKFATHLPFYEKYYNGVGKLPLREISSRYGLSPGEEKLGFTYDIKSEWYKMGNYLNVLFDGKSKIYQEQIINPNWVIDNIEKLKTSAEPIRIINKLVSIYTLEIYLRWLVNPK